jgi:hypothetical protein
MNEQTAEQILQQKLAHLPKDISPERNLWPGIEKAIQHAPLPKKQPVISTPLAWAASIVIAIFFTWQNQMQPNETGSAINVAELMQSTFIQQKSGLLVSLGNPQMTELPKIMQKQLSELHAAQTTIVNALKNDPNNTDLLNLLRFTQQQELKLITQLYQPQWQTI